LSKTAVCDGSHYEEIKPEAFLPWFIFHCLFIQFKQIPDFNCMKMQWKIKLKISEEKPGFISSISTLTSLKT